MGKVFIIAEAGVNHNGDRDMAFQLVDAAVDAGIDAVKFQTFKAEHIVTKLAEKAGYQKNTTNETESQYSMLKKLELSHKTHHELIEYCEKKGIRFLSTAFDSESVDFLVNDLGLKTLKIPSGEITNGPLILSQAFTGCDLILSTGMATLDEIQLALEVIAYGLISDADLNVQLSSSMFRQAFLSKEGQQALKEKVTLLHCTSEYPAPLEDINLKAMLSMEKKFNLNVGYSDHSEGIIVPIAATSLGAVLIEKHFTLDKSMPGPDHKASLNPDELSNMVTAIRQVEMAMGSGRKEPAAHEIKNRNVHQNVKNKEF